jgi:hypothetical protein
MKRDKYDRVITPRDPVSGTRVIYNSRDDLYFLEHDTGRTGPFRTTSAIADFCKKLNGPINPDTAA